jgi:hypothetical protein
VSERHFRFKRALLEEVCRRLTAEPRLIENGRRHLERFTANDPRMSKHYALWREVIELPVPELCARLLADTAEGEMLSASCPVFVVLPEDVRMRLARGESSLEALQAS